MTAQQSRPGSPQAARSAVGVAGISLGAFGPDHEVSGWLRVAESARLAELDRELVCDPPAGMVIVCGLVAGAVAQGNRQDRTCDRCATYVHPGLPFAAFATQPRPGVFLVGGLCDLCLTLEGA